MAPRRSSDPPEGHSLRRQLWSGLTLSLCLTNNHPPPLGLQPETVTQGALSEATEQPLYTRHVDTLGRDRLLALYHSPVDWWDSADGCQAVAWATASVHQALLRMEGFKTGRRMSLWLAWDSAEVFETYRQLFYKEKMAWILHFSTFMLFLTVCVMYRTFLVQQKLV